MKSNGYEIQFLKSNSRESVGNPGFSASKANHILLAIDNWIPYVAYRDQWNNYKATVMRFNSWKNIREAVGTPGFSAGEADWISLAMDNWIPYVAYRDLWNNWKATVMRFNSWKSNSRESVGNPVSAGPAHEISLAIDNWIPYVAYRDEWNNYNAIVMKFNTKDRETVGTPGFSVKGDKQISLAIDNWIPYVAYQDWWNNYKATVMMFADTEAAPEGESTYQRYRKDEAIPWATWLTYVVTKDDAGAEISFEVTPISSEWTKGYPVKSNSIQIKSFTSCDDVDVPAVECEALVRLYNSTNGQNWDNHKGWLHSRDISNWHGVRFGYFDGDIYPHIICIDLEKNNLYWTIPSLSGLSKLDYFHVYVNKITDIDDDAFAGLSSLKDLSLSDNHLMTLPDSIAWLSNLEKFDIDRNNICIRLLSENTLSFVNNLIWTKWQSSQDTSLCPSVVSNVSIEWIPSIWSTLKGSYTFDAWEKTRLSLGDKLSLENIEWFAFGNDGVPYVFYNTKSGSSVWKLADGRRSQVGPEFTSWTIRHIILDGNNVPYILHNDDNKNQNVFKFTNWIREQVGNIFINDNILMYWAFDNNNVPYIIYYDEKDRSSIVVKLTNWVWEQVGNNIYMNLEKNISQNMLIFDNNNIPYVKCPHNVIKLANWVWEELGDKDIFSGLLINNLILDSQNVPYVVYGVPYVVYGGTNIFKYTSWSWEWIGSFSGWNVYLTLDNNDVPYILYLYDDEYRSKDVKGINIRRKSVVYRLIDWNWQTLASPSDWVIWNIIFDSNNTAYVMYYNYGNNSQSILTFVDWTIQQVGNSFIRERLFHLTLDSNDIPYVWYSTDDKMFAFLKFSSPWEWASTYQRYRNNEAIPWATDTTYTVSSKDADATLYFEVTPVSIQWVTWTPTKSTWVKVLSTPTNNSNMDENIWKTGTNIWDRGWRGRSLKKDVCKYWDCSPSYYDWLCGICPLKPAIWNIHQAPNKPGDITDSPYSNELNSAYLRAYNQWITTKPTIQKANVDGHLIRSHMAKMMVEFASLFDKKANAWDECLFSDMDNQSKEVKYYAKTACQLRIMWLDVNENPADKFNPDGIVTRAEFGTAFSRLIFEGKVKNWKWKERYVPHLQALNDADIMKKIDEPFKEELRGYVMLMMKRSTK